MVTVSEKLRFSTAPWLPNTISRVVERSIERVFCRQRYPSGRQQLPLTSELIGPPNAPITRRWRMTYRGNKDWPRADRTSDYAYGYLSTFRCFIYLDSRTGSQLRSVRTVLRSRSISCFVSPCVRDVELAPDEAAAWKIQRYVSKVYYPWVCWEFYDQRSLYIHQVGLFDFCHFDCT